MSFKNSGPIGSLHPESKKIRIYGAGYSGLIIGHYLKKQGLNFEIFEKEPRVGGKIETQKLQYGLKETAANALFLNDDVFELLNDLQLNPIHLPEKTSKYVYRNQGFKKFPLTFSELLKTLFRLLKRPSTNDIQKVSVKDFFKNLLGEKVSHEVLSAALSGIYAANSSEIHHSSLFQYNKGDHYLAFFKKLIKRKKAQTHTLPKKSRSVSFHGGMQDLINALELELKDHIKTEESPDLDLGFNNILCTTAGEASDLLLKSKTYEDIARELREIPYRELSSTTVFFNSPIEKLNQAFGVVFCPGENFNSLGILNNSHNFPNRTQSEHHYSYTFITPRGEPKELIHEDLKRLEIDLNSIIDFVPTFWPKALPLYNEKRFNQILKLRSHFDQNNVEGLVLFGNYIDGISLREITSMAKEFVKNY